jgi:hypothetical protein
MGCPLTPYVVLQAKAKPGAVKDLSPAQLQQLVTKLIKENKALKAELAGGSAAYACLGCAVAQQSTLPITTSSGELHSCNRRTQVSSMLA